MLSKSGWTEKPDRKTRLTEINALVADNQWFCLAVFDFNVGLFFPTRRNIFFFPLGTLLSPPPGRLTAEKSNAHAPMRRPKKAGKLGESFRCG
jgi:hypothetical protein